MLTAIITRRTVGHSYVGDWLYEAEHRRLWPLGIEGGSLGQERSEALCNLPRLTYMHNKCMLFS